MKVSKIPFEKLPMLAKTDRAYAAADATLRPFYEHPVDIESFEKTIKQKQAKPVERNILTTVMQEQFQSFENFLEKNNYVIPKKSNSYEAIQSFRNENTFCVTTAHQPILFLGPLYFVYKIISTIQLSEQLKNRFPAQNFVPVFVIGGEDHDFEEVNHAHIFGKKIEWTLQNAADTGGGGSVGSMTTESLATALETLKNVLGESDSAKNIFDVINNCYSQADNYQNATQFLIYYLFSKYGLVVLNMTDARLKRLFIPLMKTEILEQKSKPLVEQTQAELQALGFKSQAFAREINLFYLQPKLRTRIVREGDHFEALNTDLRWSEAEILAELERSPELFSPNVVMRPLFQETILPNLAYVGGGGELAYWLERKRQFEAFGVPFPMLVRRNSAQFVDKNAQERAKKLGLTLPDLMEDEISLTKKYVQNQANADFSLEKQRKNLEKLFEEIAEIAKNVDASLEKTVLAEGAKQRQSIEQLEARIGKAEKQKHETALQQIRTLSTKLFPNGGLQERNDNFLPLYLKFGDTFFDILKENLNPLEQGLVVLEEDV
jgi:bacillithiol biosynthesis cysteine-adding enzyme BshC